MSEVDREVTRAMEILAFRRQRARHLPADLFSEPAWEMLLTLFIGQSTGATITLAKLCAECGPSNAVTSRWLKHLLRLDLVIGSEAADAVQGVKLTANGIRQVSAALQATN